MLPATPWSDFGMHSSFRPWFGKRRAIALRWYLLSYSYYLGGIPPITGKSINKMVSRCRRVATTQLLYLCNFLPWFGKNRTKIIIHLNEKNPGCKPAASSALRYLVARSWHSVQVLVVQSYSRHPALHPSWSLYCPSSWQVLASWSTFISADLWSRWRAQTFQRSIFCAIFHCFWSR